MPNDADNDAMTTSVRPEIQAHEFRNVKLPPFWKEEPRLWFTMLEKEFAAYSVRADAVKSSAIIRNLDVATMKIVLDVIEAPPLIDRLAKSDEANLRRLLTGMELGNKKPSELLREMTQLAGKSVGEDALRTLWIQRLPARVQDILAVVDDAPLDRQAKLADKVSERSAMAGVAAISDDAYTPPETRDARPRVQDGEVAAMARRLSRLEAQLRGRWRNNSRGRFQRNRSNSRGRNNPNGFCYYHGRFGAESTRCKKPCAWTGPDKQQGN
ncbi:uncharacterized protein LOC122404102 [Colletes gigas]|uniref:uncharacterized protein LOC122404102 n=1 Tax=Colletes gigas TaxID=935657 RepID=UPI001C9AA8F6|nr:uncharacterized protein LOC122404102 [Colletes gigas]